MVCLPKVSSSPLTGINMGKCRLIKGNGKAMVITVVSKP